MTATIVTGAGFDPFAEFGPTALDPDTLDRLQAYIDSVKPLLRLVDWDITVSRGRPIGKTSLAETFIRDDALEAWITFTTDFFDYPEPYRRKVIVHELLHPHLHGLTKYVRDMVEGEIGHTAFAIFSDDVTSREETTVDTLARGIATLFPESPSSQGLTS